MTQTKRTYCSDDEPAHGPGGCPNCTPAPAVVAECWDVDCGTVTGLATCGACSEIKKAADVSICGTCEHEIAPASLTAGEAATHRALGHDVRPVEVRS